MKKQQTQFLRLTIFISALFFSTLSMAETYSWTDANGQTYFTLSPVAAKSNINSKRAETQKTIVDTANNSLANQARYFDKNHLIMTSQLTANSQCRKVSAKMPKIYSLIRDKIEGSKAKGRMSEFQYNKAVKQMALSKQKQPSFSDCIAKYNSGNTFEINQIANNDVDRVFAYFQTKSRQNFNNLDKQFTYQ